MIRTIIGKIITMGMTKSLQSLQTCLHHLISSPDVKRVENARIAFRKHIQRSFSLYRPSLGQRIKVGVFSYCAGQVIGTSAYVLQSGRFVKGPALSAGAFMGVILCVGTLIRSH